METMVPKLVAEDIPLLHSLLSDVFPGVEYTAAEMTALRKQIRKVCEELYLVYGEGDEMGTQWVEKVTFLASINCLFCIKFVGILLYLQRKIKCLFNKYSIFI